MRKVILITSGLLLTTMLQAQSWQIKPWQKYLIDEQVKQDTAITCQSVMGLPSIPKPFETRLYRTVTGSEMIGKTYHVTRRNQSPSLVIMTLRHRFLKSRENKKRQRRWLVGSIIPLISYSTCCWISLIYF